GSHMMSNANPYENNNPYAENYEMQEDLNNAPTGHYEGSDDFVAFMNKINSINANLSRYENIINQIDAQHKDLLTQVSEEQEMELRRSLDDYISQATDLQYQLKADIKDAQRDGLHDSNKQAQAENCRQKFLKLIQDYRIIDSNYKEESKEQAKRQYTIIQPEATDEEVEAAINDVNGQQIFSQALLNANRRGEAKTALAEVQARHQELLKLEKTMAELTQLFNDMEELVIEQQENVDVIDKNVEDAQQDVEQGVGHTNKAVKSARKARKNKIRC
uniref:Protein SSO2 n=1 Tax=Saccharomyces cerevisiae (strain ATCC 204508 / S288c) TaxID=559292 RepID=UPI00216B6827|nr:Chain B, Protein SSO2 [Saccharomyces cerevisiae S288C]7Q83_D Chain D, Protein SSO2 [Saccharomyces cerevisiae S288C]